jgi:transposase-like protein
MDYNDLKRHILDLPAKEREKLLKEVRSEMHKPQEKPDLLLCRRNRLNNKQGNCPYCGSRHYVKYGIEKCSQRFKCKTCKRTFTEYSGTWLAKIHKKHLADNYIEMMENKASLDKIKAALKINKKTAFDWRHKILSSIEDVEKEKFSGITESDDTFFRLSEKGKKQTQRNPHKRGKKATKRGINDEHVAVIVTADRKSEIDLTVATLGRIKKDDIINAIDTRISSSTILCSDGHVSYKGYAIDRKIEHHHVRANLKQYVKEKVYHIQHVNNIDMRLKKWIENDFNGVSTKYLQKYLNWFRIKEALKNSKHFIKDLKVMTTLDIQALRRFKLINENYQTLLQKSTK